MRALPLYFSFILLANSLTAQFNPLTNSLVYQVPEMEKVAIQKGILYKTVHPDTALKFDIYYPPEFDKKKNLPAVIFYNGVGSLELPEWQIYKDWARLMAANGMIAVTHQSRMGKSQVDLEDLWTHLRQSTDLKIEKDNMGMWVCSANTRTGWPAANDPKNDFIKALSIYYGVLLPQDLIVKRKDLEILLVRAGLDAHSINSGMEELMISALRSDAHVEFINYPEGQHAFDGVDNTARSKEIILQTVDFFKRNLLGDNTEPASPLITNRQLWQAVLVDSKTDEAIDQFRMAYAVHRKKPVQIPIFNQLLNENNLNGLGYQLLQSGRVEDAIKIFKVNAEFFSNSPNTYDALGDAYEKKGDKANTLINAKLAIEKLEKATNLPAQFASAIRTSAQNKINAIENPEPANIPHRRAHHALAYDEKNNSIVLTAGSTPLDGGQSFRFFNDIWRYENESWVKLAPAGDERSGIALAYDSKRNKLYSFGGFLGRQSSAQLRVLENGEWKVLTDRPEMKAAEPGFVYDTKRDKLIAFGGSVTMSQVNSDTWEWDGISWNKFEGESPQGRQAFAMVYDSKRNRTILFGGMGTTSQQLYGDTWEFDGTKWTKVAENGPSPRMAVGSAFDSKRGMLVVFGGMADGKSMGDTWGWNGKKWKKLADTGPSPRAMGHMAYDKNHDRIIMFGGRPKWPNDANDTWEWDGKQWSEIMINPK
jgi:tetratricopeptide (TPR) repeat protein